MAQKKIKVGVIFGGRSGEHEVSLRSAQSVMQAIDRDKYEVIPIGITKAGKWIAGGDPLKALTGQTMNDVTEAALLSDPGRRGLMQVREGAGQAGVSLSALAEVDVMFPVLHGTFGEDGTVQGLLELANIPYVGAGVTGSAVGMDKAIFKDVMRANGIPVVEHVLLLRSEIERDDGSAIAARVEAAFPYPVFCKPVNMGSSVGVTKAHDRAELAAGLREAARWDRRVLVERGLDAREIEVSVLGNDAPQASVPGEVVPSQEFYDYRAKYIDDTSELLIPAPVPEATAAEARRLAVQVFRAIDCAGLARVDFLLERASGRLFVNELNTIPGFTQISMYPKLWEATGVSYPELIDRLLELALERQADRDNTVRDYDEAEA